MHYRLLGRSGVRVSELSLRTMTFGEEWGWGAAKDEARKIYDAYRNAGGNFIDTANLYTQGTPVEEVMRAFDDLVSQGKVLYTGVSDAPAWWIAQANTLASLRGWSPFVALQIEYSLAERTVERELIPMAKGLNIGVVAWSPLAGGVLTGKYSGGQKTTDGRYASEMMKQFLPDQARPEGIVTALRSIAQETGRSLAQVALAWLRYRPVPVIPIIGARKVSQSEDNLASVTLNLTSEQVRRLDEASAIELGFPYDLYQRDLVRGFAYGGMRDRIVA